QLSHPSIVKALEIGEQGKLHFIVMQYLDGITLAAVLQQRHTLPAVEVARIGFLVALGLQHLYERGVVHRDLNPGNIMLSPAPSPSGNTLRSGVKLLDIGLARKVFDPSSLAATQGLTNEEDILGTTDYLAPEQARDGRRADIRAD